MPRLRRFAAALLSLLVPGAGQLAIGRSRTGLRLLLSAVTAARLVVYFAGTWGGRHLLLIVLLAFLLPALYYYSLYDLLGATSRAPRADGADAYRQRLGSADGLALLGCGTLLLLLGAAPDPLAAALGLAGDYAAGAGLLLLAAALYGKRGVDVYRLGRATAALTVMAVGGLLLWDNVYDTGHVSLIGRWWPAALVLLGLEVTAVAFKGRGKKLAFDIGGLFLAGVIAFAAYGVTVYSGVPLKWIEGLTDEAADLGGFGEERGFRYELATAESELGDAIRTLVVDNPNGEVRIREGDVDRVVAEAVLWVDSEDEAEAARVAESSRIAIEEAGGDQLTVAAIGDSYGSGDRRKPRINLVVTLPRTPEPAADAAPGDAAGAAGDAEAAAGGGESSPDSAAAADSTAKPGVESPLSEADESGTGGAELPEGAENAGGIEAGDGTEAGNGDEIAGGIEAGIGDEIAGGIEAEVGEETEAVEAESGLRTIVVNVTNGPVEAIGLTAGDRVKIGSANGEIAARGIRGALEASTKNGDIAAEAIEGDVRLETFNGSIRTSGVTGAAVVSAANGSIALDRIGGDVEADTKNGEITVREAAGAVSADTLNGRIEVASAVVGGNWNIGSAVGEIVVRIPEDADADISGAVTFGEIETDLPLALGKKTVKGELGEGTYRIAIDANSSIAVKRYQASPSSSN